MSASSPPAGTGREGRVVRTASVHSPYLDLAIGTVNFYCFSVTFLTFCKTKQMIQLKSLIKNC